MSDVVDDIDTSDERDQKRVFQYHPTAEQRRVVRTMAGLGTPQASIATAMQMDLKTLKKHFREELDSGVTEANATVAQSLFNMATKDKNVAAAIFWLKIRAGWTEKSVVTIDGNVDVRRLDDKQLNDTVRAELAAYITGGTQGNAASKDSDIIH